MAETIDHDTGALADTVAPVADKIAGRKPAAQKRKPGRVKQAAAHVAQPEMPKAEVVKPATTEAKVNKAKAIRAAKPARKARPQPSVKPAKPHHEPIAAAPAPRAATASTKEARIMTTPATEITEKFQTAMKDATDKAKAAFEKSQASLGEMGAFTKGNMEAMVESTKIFAAGLQALSKGYMTESKSAFETLTAEMKELAAVKSPTELMEKQSALLRKQFDAAVAVTSKNSEAMLKLANEAFQPISSRVSIAVEKIKHAA